MNNKILLKCECGIEIFSNVYSQHVKSKKCNLSNKTKDIIFSILMIKKKHQWAWKKSEGIEATCRIDWYRSVLNKETNIIDWSFTCPRPASTQTPSARKKISLSRTGLNNPSIKNKQKYELNQLKEILKREYNSIIKENRNVGDLIIFLKKNYKDIFYQLCEIKSNNIKRGFNKQNAKIAYLLDISLEELTNQAKKNRGHKIKLGQANSVTFFSIQSENAAKRLKKFNITIPQKILFQMIKSIDFNVEIQFSIKKDKHYKVYDIYSPKINALIEMNGRVWHDETIKSIKNEKLAKIVSKNKINDVLKEQIANSLSYKYITFWDDEILNWQEQIFDIYNEESITYEKAKDKINIKNNI